MSHYETAQDDLRRAADADGGSNCERYFLNTASTQATLAVADELKAIGGHLADLLAAWRRDIDSVPHPVTFAEGGTVPAPCWAYSPRTPGNREPYDCSLLSGHHGDHQAVLDGQVLAAWPKGGA